ncbi:MAG: hypothetical protein ACI35O_09475 [Bacillaceae bacterium]
MHTMAYILDACLDVNFLFIAGAFFFLKKKKYKNDHIIHLKE